MKLKANICPNCGAKLDMETNRFGNMVHCEYCDSEFVVETDTPQEQVNVRAVPNISESVVQNTQEAPNPQLLEYKKKRNVISILLFVGSLCITTVKFSNLLFFLGLFLSGAILLVAPLLLIREKPVGKKDRIVTAIKLYFWFIAEFFFSIFLGVILFYV